MTQNANQKIRNILTKLLDRHFLGVDKPRSHEFLLTDLIENTDIDKAELQNIITQLKEKGLIEKFNFWDKNNADYEEEPDYDLYTISFSHDFRTKGTEYLTELSKDLNSELGSTLLYLDKNGDFWHGNKNQFCYPMGNSDRFALVKYLAQNKGFQDTASIAQSLGGKDAQLVRAEIGKIRGNILKFLKLEDVIVTEKDSGYGINPKYTLIVSN